MFQSEMNKEHKNPFPVFISFTSYFQLHMLKCKIQQKKKSWGEKKKNQTHEIFTLLHFVKLFYLTKPKGFKPHDKAKCSSERTIYLLTENNLTWVLCDS